MEKNKNPAFEAVGFSSFATARTIVPAVPPNTSPYVGAPQASKGGQKFPTWPEKPFIASPWWLLLLLLLFISRYHPIQNTRSSSFSPNLPRPVGFSGQVLQPTPLPTPEVQAKVVKKLKGLLHHCFPLMRPY